MNFEQLLQIYWSKGFFYNGNLQSFNLNLNNLFKTFNNFNFRNKIKFIQRLELTSFKIDYFKQLSLLTPGFKRILNIYLSQLININYNYIHLIKYTLIRLYLIKTFRGKCNFLGKPSRGQRTWSNRKTAQKLNKSLKFFINEVKKKYNTTTPVVEEKNKKLIKKKKK